MRPAGGMLPPRSGLPNRATQQRRGGRRTPTPRRCRRRLASQLRHMVAHRVPCCLLLRVHSFALGPGPRTHDHHHHVASARSRSLPAPRRLPPAILHPVAFPCLPLAVRPYQQPPPPPPSPAPSPVPSLPLSLPSALCCCSRPVTAPAARSLPPSLCAWRSSTKCVLSWSRKGVPGLERSGEAGTPFLKARRRAKIQGASGQQGSPRCSSHR
jgi:hypothetical protein